MKQFPEAREDFYCSVFSELKVLGVKVPKLKKFKSNIPKQDKSVASVCNNDTCKVFGVYLTDQEKVSEANSPLPKFIVTATSYLKRFTKKEIGLFRKAGSISRQRDLRAKLEKGESIEESEPNDVASLLKQWLRELPEPLIPAYLHDLFIRCLNLEEDEKKISAVLLCCHLLPSDHLHTLKHLLNFLFDIATDSDRNKMDAHNLALIMAPNIFVMGSDSIDKSSSSLVQHHTAVLELLINNAPKIGQMPICSSQHLLEAEALKYGTDLDLSADALDYSPSKSKKKRRSGPVQDIFSGIRKLVGQNSPLIPPKRSNLDENKSTTVTRSASKRKADPDHLSLSPIKKPAITPGVLRNEIMECTPKSTQNIFGTVKEKSRNSHSRRKSFGILRRKEKKRQKSSKSTPSEEPKVTTDTPSPFRDEFFVSCEASIEQIKDSCLDKSPLLSTSDIDRIISKTSTVKKSVSDCYLTIPDEEFKDMPVLSTFPSQGCLHLEDYKSSPYNLRSNKLTKKSSKRKLDVLNDEVKANDDQKTYKENICQNNTPSVCRKVLKVSPVIKKEASGYKVSSIVNASVLSDTKVSLNEQSCSNLSMNESNLSNFLDASETSNRRSSARRKTSGSSKDLNVSSGKISKTGEKSVTDSGCNRNEVKDTSHVALESVDQETVAVVKSKNISRNSAHNVKGTDSTSISSAKSKTNMKNEIYNTNEGTVSKHNRNIEGVRTLGRKQIKKNTRKGSIVRGRPNTVKTGLPMDLCGRFNSESFGNQRILTSTTSVDNDLFINIIDQSEKKDLNISVSSELEKLTLSTPNEKHSVAKISTQNSVRKSDLTVANKSLKTVSKIKRERMCNSSDSKMHNTRKRSSGVSRVRSFPDNARTTTRSKKLRAVNSSSPKKNKSPSKDSQKENICAEILPQAFTLIIESPGAIDNKTVRNSIEKENLHILVSPKVSNQVKTPDKNTKSPDVWTSGRKYLDSETAEEEVFNKRESIAMILKNKPGHVQAKVHLYDTRNKSSSNSTPLKSSLSTPVFSDSENSNTLNRTSQKSSSVKNNKVTSAKTCESSTKRKTRYYSPLPPPPKFVIPDVSSSPKPSYPLKELTNINGTEDASLNVSSAKDSFHTPLHDKSPFDSNNMNHHSLKKRNSYSGHTPYRLPKVFRSESSPLLTKDINKLRKKSEESLSRSPSLRPVLDHKSPSFSNANYFCSPVFKTRSSLSIERLHSDQLMDEWNCEV